MGRCRTPDRAPRRVTAAAPGGRVDGAHRDFERDTMTTTRSFPHEPQSVPAARRFATNALRGSSPETLEAVELMVSELATNCIRHTDSGFDLSITRIGDDIRVEASDHAGGTPTMRSPRPTAPSGRAPKILDML